ncbi:tyrosine-protein phosphatase [Bacillus testis]|uniref:tyrosine-protein phosphatase n=1 Tax=Bacillus testis TaxID=1622072 RepID=UPI00067EB751|nr:CpsB/CapC family capsule biosynthesis tyrosine phosphatase [Bacillus testis]
MIDIHSHILSGIDDGARHMDESILLAKMAINEGIHTIIATPHHKNGRYENPKDKILRKVEDLNTALKKEGIPLTVLPGQEVRIFGELIKDYFDDQIVSLNNQGKYIFVEFPADHIPQYAEHLFYDIQCEGLIPIIVHPERNQELIDNPYKLYNFVEKGNLTQITAGSIVGKFGKKAQKFSYQIIEHHLTHFIASDAHNTENRMFYMSDAQSFVQKEFGEKMLDLFMYNAEQLVAGQSLYIEMPQKIQQKKLSRFFGWI